MFFRLILLAYLIIQSTLSFNVLVYSPAFGGSHTNFMARLADTLTEAGHNVTFLVPVIDEARKGQLGVKLTKDVVVVEQDDYMKKEVIPFDDTMDVYWTSVMDSSNAGEMFRTFNDAFVLGCENLLRHLDVFEDMKSRNFDVAILEPLTSCGLGYFHKLGIKNVILASSCVHYDPVLSNTGEPEDYSYVPSALSKITDQMTFLERLENYKLADVTRKNFERMFDLEQEVYRRYLGEDTPDWRHLLPSASLFFTNSNPYLDFPRPIIQKTVAIGGISVDMDKIKTTKLSDEWNEILDRREKNMLISFGSMVKSIQMPEHWRDGLLEAIRGHPNVTFIWKYESDDVSFANGIDNIHFSKWVPQAALLGDRRLSAFITHGGLGSTNELAHTGIPSIMIPVFGDQHRNANMLARHGGAIVVEKSELENTEVMNKAIHSILYEESYKKNARKLADLLENQPNKPKETLVKYTEFVAKYGPFPQMDPHVRQLNWFQKTLIDVYLFIGFSYLVVIVSIYYVSRFILSKLPIKLINKKKSE